MLRDEPRPRGQEGLHPRQLRGHHEGEAGEEDGEGAEGRQGQEEGQREGEGETARPHRHSGEREETTRKDHQAPLESTAHDFWEMVLHNKIKVSVKS